MNIIDIEIENCFGIGKLNHRFEYQKTKKNSFILYAPNGTMKSSLAKTLDLISKNDPKNMPGDLVYKLRPSRFVIKDDVTALDPSRILVIRAENHLYDASSRISSFVASKELKKEYDQIYEDLESRKADYITKLKGVSKSTDCEGELTSSFRQTEKDTFFDILSLASSRIQTDSTPYTFRYNDIFDKKGAVEKFLSKNEPLLNNYIQNYQQLLSESKLFRGSANSFGTTQAQELFKSTEDNAYFEAGHTLKLSDGTEIKSALEFKDLLQAELTRIINSQSLKKSFEAVDKAIGANAELRSFKRVIDRENLLLTELKDYRGFQEKVWVGFLSVLKTETLELVNHYQGQKDAIAKIVEKSKSEIAAWASIVNTFNERFYVPFQVKLENQEDVILRQKTATLEFIYSDQKDTTMKTPKDSLMAVLSRGEQRAFYILQMLFDVESRRQNQDTTFLVLDDIADSFDYKNKYAIIEYLKDLETDGSFRLLILTHNFDFYRTACSRLQLGHESAFMAIKNPDREIVFYGGEYQNNVFDYYKKNINKPKIFISSIPFIRNLIEYFHGTSGTDYLTLTSCLHIKDKTDGITCSDILSMAQTYIVSLASKTIPFGAKKIKDHIFECANSITKETDVNEILLENKIVLSIAIRLKAEEFMISKLDGETVAAIKKNQTAALIDLVSELLDAESMKVLKKVNLMTPENIHVNAFMFEPLIDISMHHLLTLYEQVKKLS